jgi:hypothetical protein
MKTKRLIVALGMHRSGSSAITKGLEVMGVELGTHLMPADVNNVTGYFEDIEINQLNIELLKTSGHDWNTLAPIKPDDFQSEQFSPFKTRATAVLKSKLKSSSLVGIKDPRLCRLLPFWMEIFADLNLKVSYVIILRNPDNIAASLFKRDSIPRVKSLYLWLEHMLPAFEETEGLDRTVLDYDELIANPELAVETLAKQLGLEKTINQQKFESFSADFIDPNLRHHQVTSNPEKEFTPKIIKRLSSLLADTRKRKDSFNSVKFNTEIKRIDKEYRDRSDLLLYIDTLDSIVLRDHHHRIDIEAEVNLLSDSLAEKKNSLKSQKQTLAKRNLQIRDFKKLIKEQDELLTSLKSSMTDLETETEGLKISVADRETEIAALKLSAADRMTEIEALKLSAINRKADIEELKFSLADREAEIEVLKVSLTDGDSNIKALGGLLDKREAEIEVLEVSLTDRDSNIKALGELLDKRKTTIMQIEIQKRNSEIQINKLNQFIESTVSDTENLSLKLEEIESSLFWKLSFLSRKFWRIVESMFAAKKERFHLIPLNELNRIRIADNRWESTGTDPFFRLVPTSGQMPSGWVEIRTSIQTNSTESSLKLYLDCGQGLNEGSSYTIPVLSRGAVNELVFLPRNLQSLRWDPMQKKGEFRQAPILFVHKTWITRKAQMIKRVISVLTTTSADSRKENNFSWKLIFGKLNKAYETAGKVIISHRNH